MPPLQIDLEDGFDGDTIVVRADGEEVWRQEDVTTNLASSLAAIAHVEVPESAEIEVEVQTQELSAATRVETPYLEVRVVDGRLTVESSPDLPPHL
jgi:hypothetical protein